MQTFGSVTLEKHPQVKTAVEGRTEQDAPGWQKTTLWNPEPDSTRFGPHQILASVRQVEDATTQVRFLNEKGGFFGIVKTGQLTYIALPGSQIRLNDTQLDMPGDIIQGRVSSPQIPQKPAQIQTVTDQAMILGAGLASRFVPVSGDVTGYSKPSAPLVGEDSVITMLARHLQSHGIRKIIINTFYKPDVLKAQLAAVEGLEFIYIDEDQPSGTAGGLVKALEQNRIDPDKPILIMQGDAVTNANLSAFLNAHRQQDPLVSIGVRHISDDQVSQMAIVVTDRSHADEESGFVLSFKEKPTLAEAGPSRLGSIGFYVLSPQVYPLFLEAGQRKWQTSPEFDYAMDFFPGLLAQHDEAADPKRPIYAQMLQEPFYWSDIGRPDQYISTVRDIYAGYLGFPMPEAIHNYYDHGIIFWSSAHAPAKAQNAVLKGNIIVLKSPLEPNAR